MRIIRRIYLRRVLRCRLLFGQLESVWVPEREVELGQGKEEM